MFNMKILVFGGNGFIGAETVRSLIDYNDAAEITVVNRGLSWDWDTAVSVKPEVKCIHADRDKPLNQFPELCDLVKEVYHEVTIDFSGFSPDAVKESINLLTGRTDLYVYISSDSVYEVCQEKQHSNPTKETDAIRPVEETERKQAKRRDSYGDDKLSAEEVITEHCKSSNTPSYLILRLADVIGPKDSTNRFWEYQIWVEMASKYKDLPIVVPKKYQNSSLSFVFSKDVAKLITRIIYTNKQVIFNQSYNLAFSENVTLPEVLRGIERCLGLQDSFLNISFEDGDQVPQIYPSVERGPIDIAKAKADLDWTPTTMSKAIFETVEFYKEIVRKGLFSQGTERCVSRFERDPRGHV